MAKIAVDGYEISPHAGGVGRAVRSIIVRLIRLLPEDACLIFTREKAFFQADPRVEERVLPDRGGYLRWLNGPLWRALRRARPDIFLATNYVLPFLPPAKSILFEHDISVISHPEWYPKKYSFSRRFLVRRSLERATAIVVPSEFTRKEILGRYPLGVEKVRVIRYGIDEAFHRLDECLVREWKTEKGLGDRPVVGFLGSLFERRHVPLLIRAVERLRREIPGLTLFLVGANRGVFGKKEEARVRRLEWIRWEQSLPEKELPLFYSSLDAFAFLSEYEGFGFPPLEALACGTPSVVLNRASLGEIMTGLALMVEHPEEDEVGRALRQVLDDRSLRSRLARQFESRQDEFSWDRTARSLAGLIQELKGAG